MNNKEDLDKLDRQINKLLNKDEEEKEEDLDTKREVIIDRRYEYDDVDGDTKRLDKIDDIDEEEFEPEEEETTEVKTRVERLEEQEELKSHSRVGRLEEQEESLDEEENFLGEKPKKKMSKKKIIIITCSVIGILLIALILFLVLNKGKKIDTEKDEKLSKSEQKEIIEDYGDELKRVIMNYYSQQKLLLEYDDAIKLVNFDYDVKCSEHEIYDNGEIYLNKCTINKVKTRYSYGLKKEDLVPEETDDKIKVYVNKETNKASLTEPKDKDNYEVYGFNIDGAYTNLKLLSETADYVYYLDKDYSVHMLNYKTGVKVLNPLNYTNILPIKNEGVIDSSFAAVEINNLWGIYNIDTRERIVGHNYKMFASSFSMQSTEPTLYYETIALDKLIAFDGESYGLINYKNGNIILPIVYEGIALSGDYLCARDKNNNIHIFDSNSKEYLNNYDKVYGLVDGKYSLVKDGKSIKLVRPDNKEFYDYGEVEVSNRLRLFNYNDNEVYYVFNMSNEKTSDEESEYLQITYNTKYKKGKVELLEYKDIFK